MKNRIAALILAVLAGTAGGWAYLATTSTAYVLTTAPLEIEYGGIVYRFTVTYKNNAPHIDWQGVTPPQEVIDDAHDMLGWSITTLIQTPRNRGGPPA